MEQLCIKLKDITDKGYILDETVQVSDIQPEEVEPIPIEVIKIKGVVKKVGKNYLFEGRIIGSYTHTCDRCLDKAIYHLEKELQWLFEHGKRDLHLNIVIEDVTRVKKFRDLDKEELEQLAERRTYEGDEIDLTPYVWEELVLDMPYKFLCKEDCRGLCPMCGVNLNYTRCNCAIEQVDQSGEIYNNKLSELLKGLKLNVKED